MISFVETLKVKTKYRQAFCLLQIFSASKMMLSCLILEREGMLHAFDIICKTGEFAPSSSFKQKGPKFST